MDGGREGGREGEEGKERAVVRERVGRLIFPFGHHRYLMLEYNDSLHRARRLAASHDGHVTSKTTPTTTISSDDVMIYLRWLVTTQHNTKTAAAFLSVS